VPLPHYKKPPFVPDQSNERLSKLQISPNSSNLQSNPYLDMAIDLNIVPHDGDRELSIDLNIVPDEGDGELVIDLNIVPVEGDEAAIPDLNAEPAHVEGVETHHPQDQAQVPILQEDEVHRLHEDQVHYLHEDEQVSVHGIDLNITACEGQPPPQEGNVS
jgi:hypothetical protein